jgi:hypothetical protein
MLHNKPNGIYFSSFSNSLNDMSGQSYSKKVKHQIFKDRWSIHQVDKIIIKNKLGFVSLKYLIP